MLQLKLHMDAYTLVVEHFNNKLLLPRNRSFREKLNRGILVLTNVINQMNLKYIYRPFHPNTKEYNFFSAYHGPFSKIDHILRQKMFEQYKKIEITPYIVSYHHGLKLYINRNK